MADNTKDPGLDLNKFEYWIDNNKQLLSYIIGGLFVIVAGYLAFTKLYLGPKEADAQSKMFMAQKYYQKDSLKLALNGDRTNPGFLRIMDDYKWTKAANLSHYYAGVIYLKQGKFQDAVDQLKSFSVNDKLISTEAYGALGDAYTELKNFDEGVEYYKKAAYNNDNDMLSPIYLKRAGMALEHEKKYAEAKKIYEDLQSKYPNTSEGRDMDKYIARVNGLM